MSCCTEWPREKDPVLHDFYARKLLGPGWGGELNDTELAYIKAHLQKNNRLRTRWGSPAGQRRLTEEGIKAVAMWGDPGDTAHNARLVREARKRDRGVEDAAKHAQGGAQSHSPDMEVNARPVSGVVLRRG